MLGEELYDWSSFTESDGAFDLLGHMIRWGLSPDKDARKVKFKARVLTPRFTFSPYQVKAVDGSSSGTKGGSKHWLKARIIGEDSPHEFLPDPCDPALAQDPDYVYKLITMHTTFISETSIEDTEPISRGDIISVELERSGNSYNLQYGKILKLESIEDPTKNAQPSCMELKTLFGEKAQDPIAAPKIPPFRLSAPLGLMGGTTYSDEECNATSIARTPLTKEDLQALLDAGAFTDLLHLIHTGESSGMNYSAINKGLAAGGEQASILKGAFGTADLTTVTIGRLKAAGSKCAARPYTAGSACFSQYGGDPSVVFAAGRYQIIPSTLLGLLGRTYAGTLGLTVPLFPDEQAFDQNTQDMLAIVALLSKQPATGAYLMGLHDQVCAAEIGLAAEWASVPVPIDMPSGCKKGTSYYCAGSDKAANHTLSELENVLKKTRQNIQASATYAALKSSGKIPTTAPA